MTKDIIIAAIKYEAERLKKERPTVHGEPERFIHGSDQTHYDALKSALLVFTTMHAAELQLILNRAERLRREQEAQTTLEL